MVGPRMMGDAQISQNKTGEDLHATFFSCIGLGPEPP
jgi:hypothetical protein